MMQETLMNYAHGNSAKTQPRSTASSSENLFRNTEQTVLLDWDSLQRYLFTLGHELSLAHAPKQFAGGLGNLNYLVEIDGRPYVLRRPPVGPIPQGANDMAREHRVLSGLYPHYPYAPQSLLYCADPSILGAHFLIMEYRPGLIIGSALPIGVDAVQVGMQLSMTLVELLVQLHAVDTERAGLESLGKPEGFLERTIDGWAKRADAASEVSRHLLVEEIERWLRAHRVPDGEPTLLHCDFKLDNVVLDPNTLEPRAVLDWDMATRGDPLFDLATMLSYWTEPGDPPALQELRQMPTAQKGFPLRAEIVNAYASRTGRDVSNFQFYRVLTMFKLGVVFLQLHARYRTGATHDERFAGFARLGLRILEFTQDIASGRAF